MKSILFDLDGTLVDSSRDITGATNHIRKILGLPPISPKEVIPNVGDGARMLLKRLHPFLEEKELDELTLEWRKYYREHPADNTFPYPGIIELLEKLPKDNIAVVSNKPEDVVLDVIDHLDMRKYFKVIIGQKEGRKPKPSKEPLLEAIEIIGTKPEYTAMVGDGLSDILSARETGCTSIWVKWGFKNEKDLLTLKPDIIIGKPEEVLLWWNKN